MNSAGGAVAQFESTPTQLERQQALLLQRRVMDHFRSPSMVKKFDSSLDKFAKTGEAAVPVAVKKTPAKKNVVEPQANQAKANRLVISGFDEEMLHLSPGEFIETPKGKILEIVKEVDTGKRGKVYQVKNEKGQIFALKVARDKESETLASFGREQNKVKALKKYGLPHAKIHEASDVLILKDWVEGVRADAWVSEWADSGAPANAPQIKKLKELITKSAKSGVYVGDLNPKNLIWSDSGWVIVDSGGISEGLAPQEALDNFLEKIPKRWSKVTSNPISCMEKFSVLSKGISLH